MITWARGRSSWLGRRIAAFAQGGTSADADVAPPGKATMPKLAGLDRREPGLPIGYPAQSDGTIPAVARRSHSDKARQAADALPGCSDPRRVQTRDLEFGRHRVPQCPRARPVWAIFRPA